MGNKYAKPDPLDLARTGDEDALEQVLGGIVAPLFDLALIRFHQPARAETAVVEGLHAAATTIRGGNLESTPLAIAAREVLAPRPDVPELTTQASDIEQVLESLAEPERLAVLAVVACDLDADELGHALTRTPEEASDLVTRGMSSLDLSSEALRDAVEERAAAVALPFGLIDRALD